MKVLICGASGLVGYDLSQILSSQNIHWTGTYNTRSIPNSYKINFNNLSEVSDLLDKVKPTVCVNCIVERNVDLCEKNWEAIKSTNIDIINNITKACSERDIFIVHLSTDYVFDGTSPPYYTDSEANPIQNYGISKYISEQRVISHTKNYCIIRVPVLYTNTAKFLSETAVTQIGKKLLNTLCTTEEDNYSIRRPVFIPDLCNFIVDSCINKKSGIFHFYNPYDKLTKYKILELIAKYLHKPTWHILPVDTIPKEQAGRPYDTQLADVSYDISNYSITRIEDGISQCFSKLYHPVIDLESPPTESIFFYIDLDGTLIDTDLLHFQCYKKALEIHADYTLDFNTYEELPCINSYLLEKFGKPMYEIIKTEKNSLLHKTETIESIQGAKELLTYINKYNINHVVVTNTSRKNVDFFKSLMPMLEMVKNWITREDYSVSKPDPECYRLAKCLYYKNESYSIGIENSVSGYYSIKDITQCIYIVSQPNSYTYKKLKSEDCYFVRNITSLYTSVPK